MPRKPRIEYPGAVYHIMSRGNRQETIFLSDKDCELFLDTLDEACTKTGWLVHAFVLMGNHYHLLLETPEANLVAGMKWLQGTYTQRFNARHKQWGHLLQGRYKAIPVDGGSGEYFTTVSHYIHLNPARAKLFDLSNGKLSDYAWSSFPLFMRPTKRPDWLVVDRVFGNMGLQDDPSGRARCRAYMGKRVAEVARSSNPREIDSSWNEIRRGWYFGAESFRNEILDRLDEVVEGKKRSSLGGEEMRAHDDAEAERLLRSGLSNLGLNESDLTKLPKGADEKAVLAWLIRKRTTAKRSWVSDHLYMGDESRVTKLVQRVARDSKYSELKRLVNNS